jgi:SOS-response transcriptional repressor LexA
MLTTRQQQALDFIADFQAKREGKSPTFREIRDGLGLHSSGYVGNIVRDLEKLGHIRRGAGKTRNIEIVRPSQQEAA